MKILGKESFIYKIFFKNINYKILALIITLLWWAASVRNRVITQEIKIPVKFRNLSKNLVIAKYHPIEIPFLIKAKGTEIYRIKKQNLYYDVNLDGYEKGSFFLKISKYNIKNIENYNVIHTTKENKELKISIDEKVEKNVDIIPKIIGELPEDYKMIDNIKLKPSKLLIKGPKRVDKVETYPINISGIKEPVEKEVKLKLPPNTSMVNENLKIFAKINVAKLKSVTIDNVKIRVDGEYSLIYPKTINLKFKIPVSENIIELKKNIDVFIKLEDYSPGDYNLVPKIKYPENVELVDYSPKKIQIIIR